ncbi:hypothetical protein AQ862_06875 [Burkholderia pseudomallei]|nr:hypothetical protein AQ862_06875 [Burkholderia pseudomallei]
MHGTLGADSIAVIGRQGEQFAEICPGIAGLLQVFPGVLNDVRETFAGAGGFAHESENHESMKTQAQQALKIARELAWLSFLRRRRGKISLYTAVCHHGIRLGGKRIVRAFGRVSIAGCLRDWCLIGNQTEDLCGRFGQVEVCAAELADSGIAALRRAHD